MPPTDSRTNPDKKAAAAVRRWKGYNVPQDKRLKIRVSRKEGSVNVYSPFFSRTKKEEEGKKGRDEDNQFSFPINLVKHVAVGARGKNFELSGGGEEVVNGKWKEGTTIRTTS